MPLSLFPHLVTSRRDPVDGSVRGRPVRSAAAVLAALLAAQLFTGCRKAEPVGASQGVVVAVSLAPQAWLVRRIGGDRVHVEVMISGGSDPHTFQISDADVTRLARSRVFFAVGMPFEQSPACRAVLRNGNARVVDLRQDLARRGLIAIGEGHEATHDHDEHAAGHDHGHDHGHGHEHDHEHAHDEPSHIWLSPRLLKAQAETVAGVLEEIDPAGGEVYRAGLAAVSSELDALDAELRAKLAPLRGQTFFVYHPAWECFAADYELHQVAIEKDGKEPTDRELSELQQSAAETAVKLILTQPQISSRAAEAVAQTAGLRMEEADPLAPDPVAEVRRLADLLVSAYRGGSGGE